MKMNNGKATSKLEHVRQAKKWNENLFPEKCFTIKARKTLQ